MSNLILTSGKLDSHNAYIAVNAGAGGAEACDWADMLRRMYIRWAERQGFTVDVVDVQEEDPAGIRSCTLLIKGDYAYGLLNNERGVHRLVRISPFDSQSRRHTSFARVDVTPEVDDDINIEVQEDWGSPIRSYVFQPHQMVKDHRTGWEEPDVTDVMDGALPQRRK